MNVCNYECDQGIGGKERITLVESPQVDEG